MTTTTESTITRFPATAAPRNRGGPELVPSAGSQLAAMAIAPCVLRLTLAAVMLPHGLQKVFGAFGGPGPAATLEHFQQAWGVPAYLTVGVMAAELLGPLGLTLGLLTRWSAMGILAVMAGAVFLVHWPHGFFMDWQGTGSGQGFEFHLLAIGIALALLATGGGRWSLDHRLRRRRAAARVAKPAAG